MAAGFALSLLLPRHRRHRPRTPRPRDRPLVGVVRGALHRATHQTGRAWPLIIRTLVPLALVQHTKAPQSAGVVAPAAKPHPIQMHAAVEAAAAVAVIAAVVVAAGVAARAGGTGATAAKAPVLAVAAVVAAGGADQAAAAAPAPAAAAAAQRRNAATKATAAACAVMQIAVQLV